MLRLHYSDGFVVTSDEIGGAVIDYARALAQTQSSETITIPIVDGHGEIAQATMLIGPASQLYTTPADDAGPELHDQDLVRELVAKARALHPVAVVPDDTGPFIDPDEDPQHEGWP